MGPSASHAFHQRVWYVALVVHVITAWFSSGFYAADEHYQVIAFAQVKLGELNSADLPWEFEARMRSAFLPGIACAVIGTCRKLITADPFIITFLLRLITAWSALVVVRAFVRAALAQVSDQLQRPFILLSYFLWFLPYQHVRFAAETWSGLLFLLGLSVLLGSSVRNRSWLIAGVCFGMCLQLKPSMIVACGGAVCWALLNSETQGRSLARLVCGGVIALALGAVVDSWFYNEPIHTFWNYLYKNSLSISKVHPLPVASETYPWWYYFPWIMKYGIWPIGAVLLGSLLWLTYRAPRSLVVWCIWPYLLLVSAIPHKELRFLFPLVDLAPLMLVLGWQEVGNGKFVDVLKHRAVLIPIVAINTLGLLVTCTTAAGSGRTRLAEALWENKTLQAGSLGYDFDDNQIWRARIPSFYLPTPTRDIGMHHPCAHSLERIANDAPDLLIAVEPDHASGSCLPDSIGYEVIRAGEPDWTRVPMLIYNADRPRRSMLYARKDRISHPSEP